MRRLYLVLLLLSPLASPAQDDPKGPPYPFFAMDTGFRRPGLTTEQQLDLLKDLGYAGVAWTESTPDDAKKVAEQAAKRGLKMHAIYCGAKVNAKGELSHSPQLPKLMENLADHGTIVWLYLTGDGPKVATLTDKSPLVARLREVADLASKHKLRVAVYPHAGFWIANTSDAIALARTVERANFGLGYNLIHSLWAGEEKDVPALIEKAGDKLFVVTVNGAEKTRKPGFRSPILTLDKGDYDVGIVLRALKKANYRGPVGFQGYGIKGDTKAVVKPSIEAWRKLS